MVLNKLTKKLTQRSSAIDTLLFIRLGRNLKKFRLSKKASCATLSKLSSISSYSLKKIEKGEKENIDLLTLEKIRSSLNVSFSDLLD
jgi:DNA-binding Xre family transcriptional regulator